MTKDDLIKEIDNRLFAVDKCCVDNKKIEKIFKYHTGKTQIVPRLLDANVLWDIWRDLWRVTLGHEPYIPPSTTGKIPALEKSDTWVCSGKWNVGS